MAPIYSCKLKLGSNLQNQVRPSRHGPSSMRKNPKQVSGMRQTLLLVIIFPLGKNIKMGLNSTTQPACPGRRMSPKRLQTIPNISQSLKWMHFLKMVTLDPHV